VTQAGSLAWVVRTSCAFPFLQPDWCAAVPVFAQRCFHHIFLV
jgi:hypothetical protein